MKSIRSSKRVSAVLSAVGLCAAALGVSGQADAAKFPSHAFYWMHDHLPPDVPAGNPARGLIPHENWRFCKNGAQLCSVDVIRPQRLWAYHRDGFYLSRVNMPHDSIYFATGYGVGRNGLGDTYCTVGGVHLSGQKSYRGFTGSEINCSQASQLSVRYLSDRTGVDSKAAWDANSGHAAFGSYTGFGNSWEYSFNSRGSANVVREEIGLGRGIYTVTVPRFGSLENSLNGIAHVQAAHNSDFSHSQKRICTIFTKPTVNPANADELRIRIHCFGKMAAHEGEGFEVNGSLGLMETGFNFVYEFPGGGLRAAVFTEWASPGSEKFFPTHSSDPKRISVRQPTVGGVPVPGRYIVHLPGVTATGSNVQVTPVGTGGPRYCNVENWLSDGVGGTNVHVSCFAMRASGPERSSTTFYLGYYVRH